MKYLNKKEQENFIPGLKKHSCASGVRKRQEGKKGMEGTKGCIRILGKLVSEEEKIRRVTCKKGKGCDVLRGEKHFVRDGKTPTSQKRGGRDDVFL